MDGLTIQKRVYDILSESGGSSWVSARKTYDFVFSAVCEYMERVQGNVGTKTITTVANQAEYSLGNDFLNLYLKDRYDRKYIMYSINGTTYQPIYWTDYSDIIIGQAAAQPTVQRFSIIDDYAISTITGTATAAGPLVNGETVLTDSAAPFVNVNPGDSIQNLTDGSTGIVLWVNSTLSLVTALFDGTNNTWANHDSYAIAYEGRKNLVLDPEPSLSSQLLSVPYVTRPNPVYSPIRAYPMQTQDMDAIIYGAVSKYKERDQKPQEADYFYKKFDAQIRKATRQRQKAQGNDTIPVTYIRRGYSDGSGR